MSTANNQQKRPKEQLWVVMIDEVLAAYHQYMAYVEHYKRRGVPIPESIEKFLKDFADGALVPNYRMHSGGKGNGAVGGMYTAKQINRIIGRYPKGVASAVPVSFGFTQVRADHNADEAHILGHARSYGVDNWEGWMEWAREECCDAED